MIIRTMAELGRLRDMGVLPTMRPKCFRCGMTLSVPCVVWVGGDADDVHPDMNIIALHPECAEAVGADLISDGHQAQGKLGEPT